MSLPLDSSVTPVIAPETIPLDDKFSPEQKGLLKAFVSKLSKLIDNNTIKIAAQSVAFVPQSEEEKQNILALLNIFQKALKSNEIKTARSLSSFLKEKLSSSELPQAANDQSATLPSPSKAPALYRPVSLLGHAYRQLEKSYTGHVLSLIHI